MKQANIADTGYEELHKVSQMILGKSPENM